MNIKVDKKYNKLSAKELSLFFDKLFELISEEKKAFKWRKINDKTIFIQTA